MLGFFHENRLEKIGINLEKVGTVTVTLELGLLGDPYRFLRSG